MKKGLTDKVRVAHVFDAIREVEQYLVGVTYDAFLANSEKRYATIEQIEIIGEACNRISNSFKKAHPEIEWNQLAALEIFQFMNILGVDNRIVWEIAQND